MRCGATRPGYVDYLDATGRDLGRRAGAREQAAYVRRWAIGRQGGGAGEVAVIAVLVAPVSAAARAAAGDPTRADRLAGRRPAARRAGAAGVMRGASLIELLIAVAIALVISAAGVRALVEAVGRVRLAAGIRRAVGPRRRGGAAPHRRSGGRGRRACTSRLEPGAGPLVAPASIRLSSWLPPILPRVVGLDGADADDVAATDRLSILTVADGAPQAAVRRLPPRWAFRAGADVPGARRWLRRPRPACRCCGSRRGPASSWAKPTPSTPRAWTCPA